MAAPFHKPVVCPILIGRVNDLATLHALIDRAKSGTGQVVLLSGEAGIGKSRLVAEVKTYAASYDFRLLQAVAFRPITPSPTRRSWISCASLWPVTHSPNLLRR